MQYTKYSITNVKSKHSTPYMLCNILINGSPPHSNTCRAAGYFCKRHLPFSCAASGFGMRRPMTRRGALRLTMPVLSASLHFVWYQNGFRVCLFFASAVFFISDLQNIPSALFVFLPVVYIFRALRSPPSCSALDCHGCPLRQKSPRYRGPSCFLLCFSLNIRGR